MPQSFEPIIDDDTEILVIGTMPGEASLAAQEYYGHRRNLFWKIISELFNNGQDFVDYEAKLDCLRKQNIGLWDNLAYCERKGSLDSDIKLAKPNDFVRLLQRYSKVQKLVFNGQQSYKFFIKFHRQLTDVKECVVVPSTSPANARISYVNKLELWTNALSKKD